MRCTAAFFAMGILLTGCPEDPVTPPPVRDGAVDTIAADGDVADGAGDTTGDANVEDAGRPFDATVDARRPDAGPLPTPEEVPVCTEEALVPECGMCADNAVCVPDLCGGDSCLPGRPCESAEDCGDAECGPTRTCVPSAGACTDAFSCPVGFACESGSCVDRRIPCGFRESRCPRGMICSFGPGGAFPICVPGQTPCARASQCEPGSACTDIDGNGSTECVPSGLCSSNDDCEEGASCGVDPETSQARCVADGACRGTSCPSGFECADTGFGPRCVVTGSCSQNSDCPPRSICGALLPTDPLRCLTYDEEDV